MQRLSENLTVAWADCDAAGKVFYPNFYVWFDRATEKLFKANDLGFSALADKFGIIGMPLLETNATYENACLHDDELTIESWVDEWQGKTFTVRHSIVHRDGRPALSGFEKRIFVAAAPKKPSGMRAVSPPEDVVARLGGAG